MSFRKPTMQKDAKLEEFADKFQEILRTDQKKALDYLARLGKSNLRANQYIHDRYPQFVREAQLQF